MQRCLGHRHAFPRPHEALRRSVWETKSTLRTTKSYLSYKLTTSNISVKIDAQVVASDTQILKTKQCAEHISPTNFQMDNHEFLFRYHTLMTLLAKTTSFHL